MRLLTTILFLFLAQFAQATIIYLSPSGNNSNPGTIGSPKKTLEGAWAVVSAGDTIYLRGGTHAYDDMQYLQGKNGTSGNWIKVWGYPGETAVITRSASYEVVNGVDQDLIYVEGNWLWFQDLEIANFSQKSGEYTYPALRLNPTNNSRFYRIKYHDNMSPMKITGTSYNNEIRDCDFYRNQDPYGSDGVGTDVFDGGDGLVIGSIPSSTDTNYVYGCRFWWNADDGLDFWDNQAPVVVDSCWSFWNGYIAGTFTAAGNGSGFKFGPTAQYRKVTRCIASGNRSWGFVENQSTSSNQYLANNTAVNNGTLNYLFGFWGDGSGTKSFYNNITQGGGCLYDACGYQLTTTANEYTNSWNGFTVTNGDFQSTDSTQLTGARVNNTLPNITFLKLVSGSDLKDSGTDVGFGNDIGAFQYSASNVSPSANAGTDQTITLPTSSVTLSGSGTDSDGTISGYAWTKISGTGGTIVSPSSASTSVTGLTAGTYVFRLTVTDNNSATGTDDITITVNSAPSNPPTNGFKIRGRRIIFRNQ
jgi:hypothetical protein